MNTNTNNNSIAKCLNAAQLSQKYGVTRSIIHHIAANNFNISNFYSDCFKRYQLLYWDSQYFLSRVVEGVVTCEGKEFLVIYHRCTRGQVLAAKGEQVALSFREVAPEFNLPAYVLVGLPKFAGQK